MRGVRTVVLAAAIVGLATLATLTTGATAPAGAVGPPPLTGTWQCCGAGGAAAQVWVISGDTGQAYLPDGTEFGTIAVSQQGAQVSIVITYLASYSAGYVATLIGTVSTGATSMSGSWTSNVGQSGTWTATLSTGAPYTVSLVSSLSPGQNSVNVHTSVNVILSIRALTTPLTDVDVGSLMVDPTQTEVQPPTITQGFTVALGDEQVFQWTVTPTEFGPVSMSVTVTSPDFGSSHQDIAGASFLAAGVTGRQSPGRNVGDAAPIASSIGTPGADFHDVGHDLVNGAITLGAILFITFPANIFNQTFSSHYDEILLLVRRTRRRVRRWVGLSTDDTPLVAAAKSPTPGKVRWWGFGACLLCGAVLGSLLSPKFGTNSKTVAGLAATLLAFAFGAIVSWFVARQFRRHHRYGTSTYLKALPIGLGIAAVCVVISRLSNFQPGYLYGVIIGIAFAESVSDRHNAHLTAISTLSTLTVAISAWFLWIPVNHLAHLHASNIPLAVLDDVLGSVFIGGLVGTVIGLIPLTSLPGRTLTDWRKDAWLGLFFIAAFLLVSVELRPSAATTHPGAAPIVTVLVLFFLFGGGTFLMRWYFNRRAKLATLAVTSTPSQPSATPD